MQAIVLLVLCMWAVYSSQRLLPFSIKSFNNQVRRIMIEMPNSNISMNITFREPTITLPKIYLDDMHQVIMIFQ